MARIAFWYDGCDPLNRHLVRNASTLPLSARGLLDDAIDYSPEDPKNLPGLLCTQHNQTTIEKIKFKISGESQRNVHLLQENKGILNF